MKRKLLAMLLLFVLPSLLLAGPNTPYRKECALKPSESPTDSMLRFSSIYGERAIHWAVMALGDTVTFTIYGVRGDTTVIFAPPGYAEYQSIEDGIEVDSVYIDRKTSAAFAKFVGYYED
jgi:hypothetical protein